MRFTTPTFASLVLAGSLAFSVHAMAQEPARQPAPAEQPRQTRYTDQELDMFASSYQAIMEVRENMRPSWKKLKVTKKKAVSWSPAPMRKSTIWWAASA